jgi:hypothetical protein
MKNKLSLPKLAPPGAGIPAVERFFANLMVHWKAKRTSREESAAIFERERVEILRLVADVPNEVLPKRILIRRLPGLEDSSRYWSVLMTLDHLRIVNQQIAEVVAALGEGRVPTGEASTAAVKPREDVDSSVIGAFDETCREFPRVTAATPSLVTPVRFAHPWFGPLDGAGWHFMAAFHMGLHRGQILRILAGV